MGRAVNEQLERLRLGEVPSTVDGQSTIIARITGSSEEKVRSWITTLTAGALLFIQYSCLWFYGFLKHRIEPAVGALVHGPLGPRKSGHFTDNVTKTNIEKARQDILANVAAGVALSNGEYAARWGVSPSQVTKWQNIFVREGIMRKEWRGQEKVAVAPRMNGSSPHLKVIAPS